MSLVHLSEALDEVLRPRRPAQEALPRLIDWPEFEKAAGPFEPGRVIVVAGRRGMGASAFATNFALQWAGWRPLGQESAPATVAYLALDLGPRALAKRLLACVADVALREIEQDPATLQSERVQLAAERLRTTTLWLDGTPGLSVDELKNILKSLRTERDAEAPTLLVVDGFDQLRAGTLDEASEQAVALKAQGLKNLALEYKVTLVVTASVTSAVEYRGEYDKRPRAEDVKDGWALRRSADVLLLLYRDAYYFQDGTHDVMEVLVAQHPERPTEKVLMRYHGSSLRLEGLPPCDDGFDP